MYGYPVGLELIVMSTAFSVAVSQLYHTDSNRQRENVGKARPQCYFLCTNGEVVATLRLVFVPCVYAIVCRQNLNYVNESTCLRLSKLVSRLNFKN